MSPSGIHEYSHAAGHGAAAALAPARPAILSVAAEVPAGRVTTAELAERLGVTEDWIVSRTGIRERPVASARRAAVGLRRARPAGKRLRRAGVDAAEVDLVLVATLTQDELMPNAAPIVAHEIGAHARRARSTSAPPAQGSCRGCRSAPRRSRPGAPSACC